MNNNSNIRTSGPWVAVNKIIGHLFLSLLISAVWGIFQLACAQATFTNVAISPTSGTAGSNGTLAVGVTGTTKSQYAADSVSMVELVKDGTVLATQFFTVTYDSKDNPVNTARTISLQAALGVGTHSLRVRASTENGTETYTQYYTVTVASATPVNGASYSTHSAPASVTAGQSFNVSVTMVNTGSNTWANSGAQAHWLGTQNPENNMTWGKNRIPLPSASVAPGATAIFSFSLTAPSTAGTYVLQMGMLQEGLEWFGSRTPNISIQVNAAAGNPSPAFSSPAAGATFAASGGSATVSFSGSATAGSGASLTNLSLLENGTSFGSTSSSSITASKALSVGQHTIELRATNSAGKVASVTRTVTVTGAAAAPTITVSPLAMALTPGGASTVTWSTTNASSVSRSCTAPGTGYSGTVTLATSGSRSETGNVAWVGNPSTCTWTASGTGGSTSVTQTMSTSISASCLAQTPASGSYTASASGSAVWGNNSGGYTTDSNMGRALLHSGLLAAGQSGNVTVTPLGTVTSFTGTTANGITTKSYGSYCGMKLSLTPASNPVASVTAPANHAAINAAGGFAQVAISGTATAFGSETVSTIELLVNGLSFNTAYGTASTASYSNSVLLPIGTHVLQLRVTSSAGKQGLSVPATVEVVFVPEVRGRFDSVYAGSAFGWACVARDTAPTQVRIYAGGDVSSGTLLGAVTADVAAEQAVADSCETPSVLNHRWQFDLSPYRSQHAGKELFAYARATDGTYKLLSRGNSVTVPPPAQLAVTFGASPVNSRVAPGQAAAITLSGGASEDGLVTQLEVFADSGAGYQKIFNKMGQTPNLVLADVVNLSNGSYRLKLRATDSTGQQKESPAILANVTDSVLLGNVTAVRADPVAGVQLVGWACRQSVAAPLNYEVYANAPPSLGGTLVGGGVADVATEPDNAQIQQACSTLGVAHHFSFNLGNLATAGAPLYVKAFESNGASAVLPCEDNGCRMPGALRARLTVPQDADILAAGTTLVARMELSNGSGTYDAVGFQIDDQWLGGQFDSATNSYTGTRVGLVARSAPYIIVGVARQGATIVRTAPVRYYVRAAQSNPIVVITSPAASLTVNTHTTFGGLTVRGKAAASNGATIKKIELIDDLDSTLWYAENDKPTFDVPIGLKHGQHALRLRATDSQGRIGLSDALPVTVIVVPELRGRFDGVNLGTAFGWACISWTVEPTSVKLYAGGDMASGTYLGEVTANVSAEQAVADACNTPTANSHRWQVDLSSYRRDLAGKELYAYAKDVDGNYKLLQRTTGSYVVPSLSPLMASLNVSPANGRVAPGQLQSLSLSGSGVSSGDWVTELAVFVETLNSGYQIFSQTGRSQNLSLSQRVSLPSGSYWLSLRAKDASGQLKSSDRVVVNITDSELLGKVTTIRADATSGVQLVGWACRDTVAAPLQYEVYANAPPSLGGVKIANGSANVATELDNPAIQQACHTPGTAHHFLVDLNNLASQYSGAPLYVKAFDGSSSAILPCDDNNCRMPGTLRVALTTPKDNDTIAAGAPLFMRVEVTGGSGTYEAVGFHVDGAWIPAAPDSTPSTYFANKNGLAARPEPYTVLAALRQGATTVMTAPVKVRVVSGAGEVVAITNPAAGVVLQVNVLQTLRANAQASAQSVKFYANGNLIANAALSAGVWQASWLPVTAGSATLVAKAFDGAGLLIGESAAVAVTLSNAAGGDTPVPIVVDVPQLENAEGGSLPGKLMATPNGTAAYAIPLQLPPGTAGMVPSLSLVYDSAGPNGVAGLGWRVAGASSIERCGRNIASDGTADAVRFEVPVGISGTNTEQTYSSQPVDRLCLDGQRLVLVNGDSSNAAYWSPTAEYRTEVESFTRVRAAMNGTQRYFIVDFRDGRSAAFGNTADSYIEALGRSDGQAYRWYINRLSDRSGNYLSYLYTENPGTGENHLAEIRWGGNTINGQPHYAAVRLSYATLRPDVRRAYFAGAPNFEHWRLSTISSYTGIAADGSGGSLALGYTMGYQLSTASKRTLLTSVQVCDGSPHCLPATTFDYGARSSATPGFASLGVQRVGPDLVALGNNGTGSGYANSPLDEIAVGDFNGDGKDDILERYRVGANFSQQRLYESNPDGLDWTVKTPFANISGNLAVMETGDFDGDGRIDVLVADWVAGYTASNWRMCWGKLFNAGAFSCTPVTLSDEYWGRYIEAPAPMRMVRDLNGDGKDDLVLRTGRSATFAEQTYKCLSTGSGFDCFKVTGTPFNMGFGDEANGSHTSGGAYADMDGDGRVDRVDLGHCKRVLAETSGTRWECDVNADDPNRTYIVVGSSTEPGAYSFRSEWDPSPDNRTAALAPPSSGTITADFNADGYTDLVYGRASLNNSGSPIAYQGRICFSKGNGEADCRALTASTTGLDHLVMTVADFDGDGHPDVLRPGTDTWTADTVSSYFLCNVGQAGLGNSCEPWFGPTFYGISGQMMMIGTAVDQLYARNRSMFLGDFDGDGKPDIVNYTQGSKWQIYSAVDLAKPGEALDQLVRVTNGAGMAEKVEYAKVNSTEAYSPSVPAYPGTTELQQGKRMHPGRQLVRAIHRSNGNDGWLDTEYTYHGHSYDPSRRVSLGFAQIEERDVQAQIATTTWYNQEFPYVGMTRYARSLDRDDKVLVDSRISAAVRNIGQDNGIATRFPYISTEKRLRKDLNGAFLERTATASIYDDWGNPTLVTSSSYDTGDLDSSVAAVGTVVIARSYDTEKTSWRTGEMRTQSETRTMAGSSIERQMAYTYDAAGRLQTETVEPNVAALRVKKTFERDSVFGLVKRTILDWTDQEGTPRTRTVATVEYTADGRFPASQQNARSHRELLEYDPRNGALTKKTDANGLVTQAEFDGFGRERHLTANDGTETWTHYKRCNANCPPHATGVRIQDFNRWAERVAVPKLLFTNDAGQVVRSVTWGFNGKTAADIEYDSQGRVWRTWQPAYASDSEVLGRAVPAQAELERQFSYDDLDRVTLLQTKDGGGMLDNLTVYNGLEVSYTNAKQQKKVETRDVWGRMKTVADAKNRTTSFTYDAFHNLTSTVDPLNNVVRVAYDKLGRKTELLDPDLGKITYDVDALGQVWRQITPNQRPRTPVETYSTRMSYDELGRMTARVSEDHSAGWIYDKPAAQADCKTTYSCGKLVESFTLAGSVKDYRREHRYDSKGRPETVTVYQPDGSYTSRTEYDAWGRLLRERHQRAGGTERVFDRRYNGYGHLARVERGALVLWQAASADASARVLNGALGNGLSFTREYYADIGHLRKDVVDRNGTTVLEEQYLYDVLGNVLTRSQYWEDPTNLPTKRSGFSEEFTYDALNRLETARILGQDQQVFTYNEIGNLTSKTSVGAYTYPNSGANSIRPHAVSTIAGAGFSYDDNGNLLTAPGRAASWSWTSFNMPLKATKGGSHSSFVYGADRQRTSQLRSDGVTIYYAGAMETEVQGGTTTIKTYWPMGLGVEMERNGITSLRWTHLDRLGSVVAITDETGATVEKLAYDAWGARRNLTTSTPSSADGEVDNKGYTGHEMLDQLDLVHMNGRIYDPLVARFMSADPLVQDAYGSQSYNRYSYVWNNPTNHTDPSGFTAMQVVTIVGQRPVLTCDWCAKDGFQWLLRELQAGARAAPRVALRGSVILDLVLMPGNWNTRPGAGELFNADAPWRNGAKARYTPAQIEAMRKDGEESAAQQDSESLSSDTNSASLPPGGPDGDENDREKTIDEKRAKHIFRDKEGHLPDTPSNRKLLNDVANNPQNRVSVDKYGNEWFARTDANGNQVWAQVRGDRIINGGVNNPPRSPNAGTGLSAPSAPRWK